MQTRAATTGSTSHASRPFFGSQPARARAFFSPSPFVQAKLTMGAPGDPFEREADATADLVVQRMEAGRISRATTPAVQAACVACAEKEEKLQRQAEPGEEEMLQAKGLDGPAGVSASVEQHLRAGHAGHSLAPPLQAQMEQAFQADFSSVRVHTGGAAERLNHELHARAFTHGNDVYFNAGEFNPDSRAGQHLLAHELTHVVQQSGGQATHIQRACGAAAIGAPAGCTTAVPAFLSGYPSFSFTSNCDTFAAGQEAALVAHASGLPATASFEVHGYATAGGNATFNQNLSCARAQEARRALTDPLPGGAGIPAARISGAFAHGGTPGGSTRSSVVLTPPLPSALPSMVPVPAATDFEINRVGSSTTSRIFFAAGSDALTAGASTQITTLKSMAPGTVRVIGFVSAGEADALAQSRADAVEAALTAAPDAVTVSSAVGTPGAMQDRSDLVEARSVEIVVGAAAPTTVNCRARHPRTRALLNPRQQPCATMDPPTQTAFNTAHPIAQDAMTRAVAAVAGVPDAVAEPLIDRFFGNHSAATLATLRTNLGRLERKVNALTGITRCGGQCDIGGCDDGTTIAYHTPVGVSPARMVLCVPVFRSLHANDQPRNLIHETAHGTSPLGGRRGSGTEDLAYRHERMLFHLSPADRLRNSDSYALFAMFLREAQTTGIAAAVPAGIDTPASDTMPGISAVDRPAMELALATLEKRLTWSVDWMSGLYGEVNDIRGRTQTWARSWAEDLMRQAARRFPLTAPRRRPTITDQTRLAGMLDRYSRMHAAVKRDLTVTMAASGVVNWPVTAGFFAGASLSVGPDFFRATPRDQVALLLENLALATRDVEPAFVPAYVTLAEWIHSTNS